MLRAAVLGASLLVQSDFAGACSPMDYDGPHDRLVDALRYYSNAEWIAVGTASSVEFVDPELIWKNRQLNDPAVIRAGIDRPPMAYASLHPPIGVTYTFTTVAPIKGEVPGTAHVRFVDVLPSEHPLEAKADWPSRIATGAHRTFTSCDLAPTFAVGQEILLVKPSGRVVTEYYPGPGGIDLAWTLDSSSAQFRSLEPTSRSDEWYLAIKAAAMLDSGGWPIGFARW